jgi:hypothetical protein
MNDSDQLSKLFHIRNRYGFDFAAQKLNLLNELIAELPKSKKAVQAYYDTLLFLIAYPDNKSVYELANHSLNNLTTYIQSHEKIRSALFNSGITGSHLCGSFSFEIVKWLRKIYKKNITLDSFEAHDGQITSILSAVMPKVESEILQDANTTWKKWLKKSLRKGEDILDGVIAVFDQSDIRPEVKDELWIALGIFIEISFDRHTRLPDSLIKPYYHRSILKRNFTKEQTEVKPLAVKLSESESNHIIECGRMILVRHIREIDPVTFTSTHLVSYYHLSRGISVALMQMVPDRRHPIDSYFGYVAFKNGLPVAYAGSWILFDSARIGLNVFPSYRGGESQFIFDQVLKLHSNVYHLSRFSVDPYQIGKDNDDGIKSGAFWTYYHAGFRPIREEQKMLAETEALKIKNTKSYKSPASVLLKLADSRLELLLKKNAVRFDATDLSVAYVNILKKQFNNDRKTAEEQTFKKLIEFTKLKNRYEEKLNFILKNWCVLLFSNEKQLYDNNELKEILKKLFELKAYGDEEDYVTEMQKSKSVREFIEVCVRENV